MAMETFFDKGKIMFRHMLSVLQVLIFTFVFSFQARASDDSFFCQEDDTWCLGLKLAWVGSNITIEEMPLKVRDVPIHPDDDYAPRANQGPIDKLEYDLDGSLQLGLTGFWRFPDLYDARLGASLLWFYPFTEGGDKRNYTNAVGTSKRGTGAALTYTKFRLNGIFPITKERWSVALLSITPEVYAEVPLLKEAEMFIGGSVSYFNVYAENGWDRYNSLEVRRQYTMGHFIPVTGYLHWGFVGFGASYPLKVAETSLGKEAHIKSGLTYYVSLRSFF